MIQEPDPARDRFIIIQVMRWTGAAMALAGILILNRRIPLPEIAGAALVLIGLFDALIVPTLLARRWKSPPP